MKHKRLMGGVLTLAATASMYLIFNKLVRLDKIFSEGIKQNVVYTTPESSIWTEDAVDKATVGKAQVEETKINNNNVNSETAASKPEVNKAEGNQSKSNNTSVSKPPIESAINNNNAANGNPGQAEQPQKNNNENSQSKVISEFKKYLNVLPETDDNSNNVDIDKSTVYEHNKFQWISIIHFNSYEAIYNEYTQEIEGVIYKPSAVDYKDKQAASLEQCKSTAEKFILENNIADIKNPQFMASENSDTYIGYFYYQDANDQAKKANIILDVYSNKVLGFYTKDLLDPQVEEKLGIFQ